jgi:type II secretion system protein H
MIFYGMRFADIDLIERFKPLSRHKVKIKNKSGFTLIELLIVIAILGIVLAIAAPNFIAYRNKTNLREAARDVASDVYNYKQMAVSQNVRYTITFDVNANSYTVARETTFGSNLFNNIVIKKIGAGNASITMVAAPSFVPGGTTLFLFPRGTSSSGSVRLRHSRIITILTITTNAMGRVHVD